MDESQGFNEHIEIQDDDSAAQTLLVEGKGGVYSLPNELVVKIFQELAMDATSPYRWVAVIRVCRLWRDIAIGAPSLWTYITTAAFPALDTVLSRSRDAPLTFMLTILLQSWRKPFPQASDRELGLLDLHRTTRYELHGVYTMVERFLDHPHPQGASRLQTLRLHSQQALSNYTGEWSVPLPSLTKLSLDNLPTRLVCQLAPRNLQKLYLRYLAPRTAVSSFLKVLSNFPHLRSLSVARSLTPDPSDVISPPGAGGGVTLCHLKEIDIEDAYPIVAPLFSRLSFPNSTQTRIDTDVSDRAEAEHLLTALRGHLSRPAVAVAPAAAPPLEICLIWCRRWTHSVHFFPPDDSLSLVTPWSRCVSSVFSALINLSCDCPDDACQCGLARTMATLPSMFAISRLRFLSLDLLSVNMLKSFYDTLQQMTSVEQLSVPPDIATVILQELPQTTGDDSHGRARPLFPALRSVVVAESPDGTPQTAENYRNLLEVIARRRQLPGIAQLEDVHVRTMTRAEGMYEEIQGHSGVFVQFHCHLEK